MFCVYLEPKQVIEHIAVTWPRGAIDQRHVNPVSVSNNSSRRRRMQRWMTTLKSYKTHEGVGIMRTKILYSNQNIDISWSCSLQENIVIHLMAINYFARNSYI